MYIYIRIQVQQRKKAVNQRTEPAVPTVNGVNGKKEEEEKEQEQEVAVIGGVGSGGAAQAILETPLHQHESKGG